MTFEFLMGLQW